MWLITLHLLLFSTFSESLAYKHKILLLAKEESGLLLSVNEAFEKSKQLLTSNNVEFEGVNCQIPNSGTNPAAVTNAMCECIADTPVSAIVGPYTSDQTLVVAYLASLMKVPVISPSASAGILLEKGSWTSTLYRLIPNNKKQAVAIADLLLYFTWTQAAVIYTTDIYGMSLALYTMQECGLRDIKISTSVVLKTGSTGDVIRKTFEDQLVMYEPRVVLLLVPKSETDLIVSTAYALGLIGTDTAWVVGDGTTYFLASAVGFTKLMYKGMLAMDQYLDTDSDDILALQSKYLQQNIDFTSLSSGVYYSTLLLTKALENITDPPVAAGCKSEWGQGDAAVQALSQIYHFDESTNYNLSFGDTMTLKDARFTIMNYNGNKLIRVGEWHDNGMAIDSNKITWHGTTKPDDTATSIRAVLRLGITRDPPFIIYKKDNNASLECEGNECFEGFCVDVLNLLQAQLGFGYEFVDSYDGKFGSVDANGSWNGLVRMLVDKEIHAATVGLGTSSKREEVIDFSANMLDGGVYLLNKKHEDSRSSFFFMKPFDGKLWWGLLVGGVVTIVIVWLLDRYSLAARLEAKLKEARAKEKELLSDSGESEDEDNDSISMAQSIWLVVCSFLCTAPADEIPRSWGSRIVLSGWWVICLVMISTYTADLAAYLTVSRMKSGYTAIEQIMDDPNIKWGTVKGSVTQLLLENSSIKKQRDLIAMANNVDTYEEGIDRVREGGYMLLYGIGPLEYAEGQPPCDLEVLDIQLAMFGADNVDSYSEGIRRVQEGEFVFIYGIGPLQYASGQEPCNMEVLDIPLVTFGYAFAFPQNSPYRDTINTAILSLQETGATVDLWNKWAQSGCSASKASVKDVTTKSVTLDNLVDLLWIFIPLVLIAIALSAAEWLKHYYDAVSGKNSRAVSPLTNGRARVGRVDERSSKC